MHFIYYYAERHYAKCRSTDTPKVANIIRKYKTQMKILYLTILSGALQRFNKLPSSYNITWKI
jgi:hypothetical protein